MFSHYKGNSEDAMGKPGVLKLLRTGTLPDFSLAAEGDYFAHAFAGSINVPREGVYTFFVKANDGGRLWVDGDVVADNSKRGGNEASGEVKLEAGEHKIGLWYYQFTRDAELDVSWSGPGIEKQKIPTSVLSHARGQAALDEVVSLLTMEQVDALEHAAEMGGMMCARVRNIGRDLSYLRKPPVLAIQNLLSHQRPETVWAAGTVLAMIGPEARAALPALERTFRDDNQDIGARVQAARAIAEITGTNAYELCRAIPNVEQKLVTSSREMIASLQSAEMWKKHLANETPEMWKAYRNSKRNIERAKVLHDLATGRNLKGANQWLRDHKERGRELVFLFGSKSRQFPGRLAADIENQIKEENLFAKVNTDKGDWGRPKPSSMLRQILERKGAFVQGMHNWLTRTDSMAYLRMEFLKDDPRYRNRKFDIFKSKHPLFRHLDLQQGGDTVIERYELKRECWRRGLKECALHGLFSELGSGHYEQKTYWGIRWIRDFATDPVIAKRVEMFMDLAMVEIAQASLSGVRGGAKSRTKSGGLGTRLDRDLSKLLGEHHQYSLDLPGFKQYLAPEAAILLRRMGPTVPVYEIVNRLPQERAGKGADWEGTKLLSRSVNYIYRTPEYTIGCAMFDPTKKYGPLGLWSGVITRDKRAVYLDAYTGEKWNVQDKDVMITQRLKGNYYGGDARLDFTLGWDITEKDGWIFASNGEAYVAVNVVKGGYTWTTPDRQIVPGDIHAPTIIQSGRKAVYESFAGFQKAVLEARLELTEDKLVYEGPNSREIEFFLADDPYILPKIGGETLNLDLEYDYKSPFMECKTGSDIVTVTYGDRKWEYDFEKNTVTEMK